MKKRFAGGLIFMIFGALIAFGPRTVFPVCALMNDRVMKCFWAARAELGIGLVIVLLGVLWILFRSPPLRLGLGIGVFLNGFLALLVPTLLIGVCPGEHMPCHVLTRPSLILASGVLMITAGALGAAIVFSIRRQNQNTETIL